jgi:hypothetical protein
MKKITIIAILMSVILLGFQNKELIAAPAVLTPAVLESNSFHAISDTVRTKDAKVKIKANPSMIAKVKLLLVESLDGEVLYKKYAADNVSTVLRFKVTPDTKRVKIKYGGKATEIELENGVGSFNFTAKS